MDGMVELSIHCVKSRNGEHVCVRKGGPKVKRNAPANVVVKAMRFGVFVDGGYL
jgi:hypothetical protein